MMTAKDWMEFPGVIRIDVDEEPPEATVPREDEYGNPLKYIDGDIKYLVRKAYFTNTTYIQAVRIKRKDKKPDYDTREENRQAVKRAYEEVKREAEELRRRYNEDK